MSKPGGIREPAWKVALGFRIPSPLAFGYAVLMLTLRTPRPDEAAILTALCLRSKAVWGYDQDFMQTCRDELTLTPERMLASRLQVAEIGGDLAGIAQLTVTGGVATLDKLFVEPGRLGAGAGRALFNWARRLASAAGALTLVIEADPNAAEFYRRMGAVDDGVVLSGSVPGRLLPRLTLALACLTGLGDGCRDAARRARRRWTDPPS